MGLINVPNGQMIVRDNLYHQVLSEHINYWTPLSLSMLAYKAGFDVIRIEEYDNLIELDLYLRKSIRKESMNEAKEFAKKRLVDLVQSSESIIVWGAGVKAHTYGELIEDIEVAHIVDSSVGKVGKYISGLDIPIELVTHEIVEKSDAVIIFASSYNNEIIHDLREKYDYQKPIILFNNNRLEIDEKDKNIKTSL